MSSAVLGYGNPRARAGLDSCRGPTMTCTDRSGNCQAGFFGGLTLAGVVITATSGRRRSTRA